MDDIFRISNEHGVKMEMLSQDSTELTFTWVIQYQYSSQQAQAIIACMALLSSHHVVPAEVVYQKPIQSTQDQLKKFRSILEKANGEKKPEVA
tara:strand:+ start:252 stop:530 length:279 start_codon:yes stop_codon:yes gene_type:complete